MTDDTCPPQNADQMAKDLPDNLSGTMQSMGIESCKTTQNSDSWKMAGAARMSAGLGLLGEATMSMSAGGLKTASSSTGCEQVLAISKKNLDVVNNITCVLNKTYMDTSQAVKEMNSITLDIAGDYAPTCDVTIDQQNKVKLSATTTFGDDQIENITNKLNDNVKDVASVLQTSTTGYGATPQGSKELQDIYNKSVHGDYKAQIKDTVMKMTQIADQTNTLTLHVGGNYRPAGKFCTISQSNVAEFVANQLINQTLTDHFQDYTTKMTEWDSNNTQAAVNTGAPELKLDQAKLPDSSLQSALKGFGDMSGSSKAMSISSSVLICIIIIIVISVVIYIYV